MTTTENFTQVSLAWAAATLDRSILHLVRSFTPGF
jgi:hypothetical protein